MISGRVLYLAVFHQHKFLGSRLTLDLWILTNEINFNFSWRYAIGSEVWTDTEFAFQKWHAFIYNFLYMHLYIKLLNHVHHLYEEFLQS